eukprot:c8866_g1_i1.p1 GENE.c8866_g1_i1~~c8866_g1_i1.p1  ORF type:complete len:316 (+),score=83.82 c8866_g1_i1:44-991(+)
MSVNVVVKHPQLAALDVQLSLGRCDTIRYIQHVLQQKWEQKDVPSLYSGLSLLSPSLTLVDVFGVSVDSGEMFVLRCLPFQSQPNSQSINSLQQQVAIASAVAAASASAQLQFWLAHQGNSISHKIRPSNFPESPTSELGCDNNSNTPAEPFEPATTEPAQPVEENAQAANADPAAPVIDLNLIKELKILLKLALLVFILSRGKSKEDILPYAIGAFILFLFQTGRLAFLFNLFPRLSLAELMQPNPLGNNNNNNNQPQPQSQPNNDSDQPSQPPQQQQQQQNNRGFVRHFILSVFAYIVTLNPAWDPLIVLDEH